jgi:hypothetical protein
LFARDLVASHNAAAARRERIGSIVVSENAQPAGAQAAPAAQAQEASLAQAPPSTGPAQAAAADAQAANAEELAQEKDRKLDSENRSLRQRLAAAERRVQEHEDAKLSEQDRLQKRATELEAAVQQAQAAERTLRTRLAVERQARAMRLVDEDAAYRLLDQAAITYGDDGEPTNIDTLLKALVKAKPYLAQPEQPTAPTTPEYQRPAPIGATPRPENGRATSEALLRDTEVAAGRRVKQLWGVG